MDYLSFSLLVDYSIHPYASSFSILSFFLANGSTTYYIIVVKNLRLSTHKIKIRQTFILCVLIAWCLSFTHSDTVITPDTPRLGVWISIFSPEEILFSKENAKKVITACKNEGIDHIYLQIYRADKAYYDSDITDRSAYENMLSKTGSDPINYILSESKKHNIKVYAWVNLLSVSHNKGANILKNFGTEALTVDQHGRTPLKKGNTDEWDKYYIRENQLFLEPGDERVRKYLVSICAEVVRKYPGFSGIHLDYIRYPAAVPFSLGSRFDSHGISYGYGELNTDNFRSATGLDIFNMKYSRDNHKKWDDWRREQVTSLVRAISEKVRVLSPDSEMSCTIVPSIERTYLVTFQNWAKWLREGLIDYVVVMNYTENTELMDLNSRSLLFSDLRDDIYIGIGAYLMKHQTAVVEEQLEILKDLAPGGIVIFSYDDIAASEQLQNFLEEDYKL